MSKRGKEKKAEKVEKRRILAEEALECLAAKQVVESQMATVLKRPPKQCTFHYCLRYVDPSCTICPYCGHPLDEEQAQVSMPISALQWS
jgi:hypothetical protein